MMRPRSRARRIALACALAVGLVGATLAGFAWAFRNELPPTPAEVEVEVPAPDVHLVGESSDEVTLRSEIEGHPSVVVLFRGAWCPYCRNELGRLAEELAKQPTSDVRVIGISADPPEAHADLQRELSLPFPLFSDREDRTSAICHFAMHCVLIYDSRAVLRWAGYAESWHAPVDYGTVLRAARGLR